MERVTLVLEPGPRGEGRGDGWPGPRLCGLPPRPRTDALSPGKLIHTDQDLR